MADTQQKKARTSRPTLALAKYSRLFAIWNFIGWLFLLWIFSRVIFFWMNSDELLNREWVVFYAAWAGFFVGTVVFCSATLQSRRMLILGWLAPTSAEWAEFDKKRTNSLKGTYWLPAFSIGLSMAAVLGGLAYLPGQLGGEPAISRLAFLFYTTLLPAVCVIPLTYFVARFAVARFALARKHGQPHSVRRFNYVLFHNLLPYVLLSSGVGLVVAFARFLPSYNQGIEIPVDEFNIHISVTAFGIALLVVAAARFKTRVDALGPLVLQGSRPRGLSWRWSFWYALLIGIIVYLFLWTGFAIAGLEGLTAETAVIVKVGTCLLTALTTAYWGVTSVLREISKDGIDAHPYLRWAKKMRESKFLLDEIDI
jgi:hypothetical protein